MFQLILLVLALITALFAYEKGGMQLALLVLAFYGIYMMFR